MTAALTRLGVHRIPVPVPFPEAGGPANVYVIEEEGGGVALFDAGIGTKDGRDALHAGFAKIGVSLGEVRRIFVSHGHVDHYGYARAAQEASGAPVYAHVSDHDKLTGRDRTRQRLERYEAYLTSPARAEPFSGHAAIIDRQLAFYEKRQQRILELLQPGPRTPAELAPLVFPHAREHQLYLTLSEVMGNLEVLEASGRVVRGERDGRIRFEAV